MNLIRLYSDAAGESHFEQVDLKLTLREFACPLRLHSVLATPNPLRITSS